MKTYRVYQHPAGDMEAVKEGFSWPGLFFGWIWAFVKGLPAYGVELLALTVLSFAVSVIANEVLGAIFGFAPFLWAGIEGNAWRQQKLSQKGYTLVAELEAETPEGATGRALTDLRKKSLRVQTPAAAAAMPTSQNPASRANTPDGGASQSAAYESAPILTSKYCSRCGSQHAEGGAFCSGCGHRRH